MEVIFELLLQFILEVVFQFIGQILVELGFDWFVVWAKKKIKGDPIYIGITYFLIGLFLGGFSVLFFPEPIIKNYFVKISYFVFSPILIGLSVCFFDWLFKRKAIGERFFKVEKFVDGAVFALAYSLTRFYFNL